MPVNTSLQEAQGMLGYWATLGSSVVPGGAQLCWNFSQYPRKDAQVVPLIAGFSKVRFVMLGISEWGLPEHSSPHSITESSRIISCSCTSSHDKLSTWFWLGGSGMNSYFATSSMLLCFVPDYKMISPHAPLYALQWDSIQYKEH